jgi:acyl-CoA thioesterase
VETSHFGRATAAHPHADGGYRLDIGAEWNCPIVPHGGTVVAAAARAMEHALNEPAQRLRTVSAVFAQQVHAGEIVADVQVLRRGRSMSQCTATLRNPDADAGATAIAVFGAPRKGFSFTDTRPPAVPKPEDCPRFRDPVPEGIDFEFDHEPFPFWEHIEGRPALGHPPWEDYVPTTSMHATWYRFDDPPRTADGCWDPLAVLALCDTMPGAVGEYLGNGKELEMWMPPSADFTCHLLDEAPGEWILAVNRARQAGEGYASVDMEMWDFSRPEPTLVAYATQVMFFVFPKP